MSIQKIAPYFILLIILLSSCSQKDQEMGKQFDDFYPEDASHITKIIMLDGNNGQSVTTAFQDDIAGFIDWLDGLAYTRCPDQSPSGGYTYWADLYELDRKVLRLTFGGSIVKIDGVCYELNKDIRGELDEFYEAFGGRAKDS